jgi:hypothetical protein
MIVIYVRIVGIHMSHIFLCNILVTRDLGRILAIIYVMLSLPSLGFPWELVNIFYRDCESRGS